MTFRPGRPDDVDWMRETTLAGIGHWGHDRRFPAAVAGLASFLADRSLARRGEPELPSGNER